MSSIKKINEDSTHVAPGTELTATELIELFVDNELGHRDLVYGDRPIKGAAPAHDHGQNGGRAQQYPLVNVTFASQRQSGVAAPGVLLATPQSGVDTSVATGTPKRLMSIPVFAPGGVSEVKIRCSVVVEDEFISSDIRARLGFFDHALYNYAEHPGIDITLTYSGFGGSIELLTAENIDLTELGDCTQDRELELVLYQATVPVNDGNTLSGVIVYATGFTRGRRVTQRDLAYRPVQPADVIGQTTNPNLTALIRNQENQRSIALLGRAPGLTSSLTPDKRRPFIDKIYYPHQHQGVLCPDGFGGFVSDGRVIRRQHASAYCVSVGEDGSSNVDGDPGRGALIHPYPDDPGIKCYFLRRLPVSCGTPFLDIRFALMPSTTDRYTRLTITASMFPAASFTLIGGVYGSADERYPIKYLTSGRRYRSALYNGNAHVIQVDPLDHPAWYRDTELAPELGRWTKAILRGPSEVPRGTNLTYPYRVSQVVTAHLSQPAIRPDDGAHATMDWHLAVTFSLETLDSESYDTGARLLWWTAIPRDME
jgi:hypothetical protein